MPTITTKDGTNIFYKDWGSGQPVVFSHGWPLNADAWDEQLFFFASNGYRAIAHDRRGHGRSTQTWNGNDMNTYADDLAAVVESLGIGDCIHIGHSTGGGEVARYIARHGTDRVAAAVLLDSVVPGLVKPGGADMKIFDQIRDGLTKDRSQYYFDLAQSFYSVNHLGDKVSHGTIEQFWRLSMQCGFKGAYDCVKAFSETDFSDDCKRIDVPTLVIHGDDDQIVPYAIGSQSAKMINGAVLKTYKGAPHGLMSTHRDQLHQDLLQFARANPSAETRATQTATTRPRPQPENRREP